MLRHRVLALALLLTAASAFPACSSTEEINPHARPALSQRATIKLEMIGRYASNAFASSAAQACAHDATNAVLFVVNAGGNRVDVLSLADPTSPVLHAETPSIDTKPFVASGAGSPTSVAVSGNVMAIAVADTANPQGPGAVVIFDTGNLDVPAGQIAVGVGPGALTFSPDGSKILTANEGVPNDLYTDDPEGTVSIIDISNGAPAAAETRVTFADFNDKRDDLLASGVRIFGGGPDGPATVAQDLEPEHVAVSADSKMAWVTLQENNALAIIDIDSATVTEIVPLGFKDLREKANAIDPTDREGGPGKPAIAFQTASGPVFGMYQPAAICAFAIGETPYLATANQGASRNYTGYSEEGDNRIKDFTLDADAFPDGDFQSDDQFGRLRVTTVNGDIDDDGAYEELYAFGARSVSIWDAKGKLVWDSGDQLERITAGTVFKHFNCDDELSSALDYRSDDKGPEPEALAVGVLEGRVYAFVGLARVGGVVVFDVTDPTAPEFQHYINTRDFTIEPDATTDLGPRDIDFVAPDASPTGKALLIVSNAISGSVVIFQINTIGGE